MSGESELTLVSRAVAGDEDALTTLLESTGVEVRARLERSYRRRLAGEVDLDDVMQVTYMEAFLRVRSFVPAGPKAFRAWLNRIAENNLLDAIRKSDTLERRRPVTSERGGGASGGGEFDPVAASESPSHIVGRNESGALLEAALSQLPPDYERVIRLYDLDGRTGLEVARIMGRSHGAVKMLVARARDRLSELLGSSSKFFYRTE